MREFKTTNWADVRLARDRSTPEGASAFARLMDQYWPALIAHLVTQRRVPAVDAEDVLQQFVIDKLIERELLATADSEKGRFRTFILTVLDRFLIDWRRKGNRARPLDSISNGPEPASSGLEIDAFEVSWAESMVADALAETCRFFNATDRPHFWKLFERRVVEPAYGEASDFRGMISELGFTSPRTASAALITAKRAFRRNLEAMLGKDPASSEAELRDLMKILNRRAIPTTFDRINVEK